ncbi:MAG TPA: lipoprotein signal peptidase [Crenotrichaceae bacterium]|nr:lipoprotein signal peptidase [Crenotrichaceae bacterium]
MRVWMLVAFLVVLLDQFSKWWVRELFELYEAFPLLPGLQFIYVRNLGAAFSFLSSAGGWQRWFFIVLSLLASIAIMIWIYRLPKQRRLEALGLSLVLGGAVGNLVDRVLLGYVVDFIDVYYRSWHWPVFNVADSAITVGVAVMIIDIIFYQRHELSE